MATRRRPLEPEPTQPVVILAELAEEWLAAKQLGSSSDTDASTKARRGDLGRLGRLFTMTAGYDISDEGTFDLDVEWANVTLTHLNTETVIRVLGVLKTSYAPATATRTLSTLRGFCGWLVTRGHLTSDPTADDTVKLPKVRGDAPYHAYSSEDVEQMRRAAANPAANLRTAWAARDVAIVEVLAGCGLRASEICALRRQDVASAGERPALHLERGTKGGRPRRVPLPRRANAAVERYLAERNERAAADSSLVTCPAVFIRTNGDPMNVQFVDRLTERLADAAGVIRPQQVLAHGFRHHYGTQLALRNVPQAVIQELMGHADPRVTAVYTRSVGRHLNEALEDAGWL